MSTLFDDNLQPTPEAVTDEAIARADEHAHETWRLAALKAVVMCAERMERFTADDVHAMLERCAPDVATHDTRALGAIMRIAKIEGVIAATDEYRRSERLVAHRGPKQVWRSLVWKENQ